MNSKYEKVIQKINSGMLERKELENLLKNATKKGADDVIEACNAMLSKMPKSKSGGGKRVSDEVLQKRKGYNIMASAYDAENNLLRPELIEVAEYHANNNLITDISVRKTQVTLYYRGRHFTSGVNTKKGLFWVSVLDETKISDTTVEDWKKIGEVVGGIYFSTRYVTVEVDELNKLGAALDCVVFT